jgi:hypothetical protein
MPDPLAVKLAAWREDAERVTAHVAERGWTSSDDAWDETGPMGIAEWSAAEGARRTLRLIAATETALEALTRHQGVFTDANGSVCVGCLRPEPCPDTALVTAALLGEAPDASD